MAITNRPITSNRGGPPQHSTAVLQSLALEPVWADAEVAETKLVVRDAMIVTVGGGLGSFALVDLLRVAGVPRRDLRVVTPMRRPHDRFASLCSASQIALDDRLRSDSMSRIDNVWGWPSYAFSEARSERTLVPIWRVLVEPLLCEHFNPRARTVYKGLQREAERIAWDEMVVPGRARWVRPRRAGGYFVVVDDIEPGQPASVWRAAHVHLAVGYPRVRRLPDLVDHQTTYGQEARMVNAYEPHDHLYRHLRTSPGRVLLRGSGIAASRVLERLIEEREVGAEIEIVHLFRHWVDGPVGPRQFRRPGGEGFAYQPFTFPKAAGGGQLRDRVLRAEDVERGALITAMGGTTTVGRRRWRRQLQAGRCQGWYRTLHGELSDVTVTGGGRALARVNTAEGVEEVVADWIIDATGLDSDVRQHPLLADLLACRLARTNPLGRLDVTPAFEIEAGRSGQGRLYASGAMTLGGYLAPVDSFWGLSHASVEIADDLARLGAAPRLSTRRSVTQWWRWMRGRQP